MYKGTKTEENLKKAFAGESEARNKYDFFASQAKKYGLQLYTWHSRQRWMNHVLDKTSPHRSWES